jgi:hypothetical protein
MDLKHLFVAATATAFILGNGDADGETLNDVGVFTCVIDRWEEDPERGDRLIDFAGRGVGVPNDPAAPKFAGDCVGKFEATPDNHWTGRGTCTFTFKSGDKMFGAFEAGSHLNEYSYKITGGTGKYVDASGGGAFVYEVLTDTLVGGNYKGESILP